MSNLLPPGKYRAVALPQRGDDGLLTQAQFGRSKPPSNKEYVAVTFHIIEGAHMEWKLTWFGYFTDKTWKRTFESLRHMGWIGDDLAQLSSQKLDNEVEIVVEHEEDQQGNPRARVKWVNSGSGGGGVKVEQPLAGADLRMFAAKMKSMAQQVPEIKGGKRAAIPAVGSRPTTQQEMGGPMAPPDDDDDVGF